MKNIIYIAIAIMLFSTGLNALECKKERDRLKSVRDVIQSSPELKQKDIGIVDNFRAMFENGETTGQVRSVYAGYTQGNNGENDTHATAIGGELKYELAKYKGINAGFALRYSEDLNSLSGDTSKAKRNDNYLLRIKK